MLVCEGTSRNIEMASLKSRSTGKAFHTVRERLVSKRHKEYVRRLVQPPNALPKDTMGIVIFSAAPFALVQAFADSTWGKELLQRLKDEKPKLQRMAADVERQRAAAKKSLPYYGLSRPTWLGPIAVTVPEYLDGELPGDYGWDPLGLGKSTEQLDRYVELEILHARWAMLGALGALVPEVLQAVGASDFPEPRWWNVGAFKLQSGEDLNYFGIDGLRVAGGQGIATIAACQVLLMFGPEYARACGIEALEPLGIYLPGDKNYPGGWIFDPLQLSKDPKSFESMKVREIKNGRLAMIAWLGFFAQAAVTQKGPVENLSDALHMDFAVKW